jgi:hypothetical protein
VGDGKSWCDDDITRQPSECWLAESENDAHARRKREIEVDKYSLAWLRQKEVVIRVEASTSDASMYLRIADQPERMRIASRLLETQCLRLPVTNAQGVSRPQAAERTKMTQHEVSGKTIVVTSVPTPWYSMWGHCPQINPDRHHSYLLQ